MRGWKLRLRNEWMTFFWGFDFLASEQWWSSLFSWLRVNLLFISGRITSPINMWKWGSVTVLISQSLGKLMYCTALNALNHIPDEGNFDRTNELIVLLNLIHSLFRYLFLVLYEFKWKRYCWMQLNLLKMLFKRPKDIHMNARFIP